MTPEPPINVRLVDADGKEWPVDCMFDGYDDTGHARWIVLLDHIPVGLPMWALRVGLLPAHSSVEVPAA